MKSSMALKRKWIIVTWKTRKTMTRKKMGTVKTTTLSCQRVPHLCPTKAWKKTAMLKVMV